MSVLQTRVNRLIASVQEEIDVQRKLLALLDEQEVAVRGRASDELEEATQRLRELVSGAASRATRREAVLAELGTEFGVSPKLLTLSSIVERARVTLGDGVDVLAARALELRDVAREVSTRGRRVGALVALHRRVVRELVEVLLTDENGNPLTDEGTLVDAEA